MDGICQHWPDEILDFLRLMASKRGDDKISEKSVRDFHYPSTKDKISEISEKSVRDFSPVSYPSTVTIQESHDAGTESSELVFVSSYVSEGYRNLIVPSITTEITSNCLQANREFNTLTCLQVVMVV